jgi:hypothetical protein
VRRWHASLYPAAQGPSSTRLLRPAREGFRRRIYRAFRVSGACCQNPTVVIAKLIDSPSVTLPAELPVDILVFPRQISDGRGLYDDSVVTLVKELREAGATAAYQHDRESREWIGEKAVPAVALMIVVGIATNAGWEALRAVFRRHKSDRVHVKAARCTQTSAGTRWEWFEAEGTGDELATALEALEFPVPGELEASDEQGE